MPRGKKHTAEQIIGKLREADLRSPRAALRKRLRRQSASPYRRISVGGKSTAGFAQIRPRD